MNEKQIIPVIARIAPPLLIVGAIFFALQWLFSGENKEKKPGAAPADAGAESRRKEAESTHETPVFRNISAEIPIKPTATSVPSAPSVVIAPPTIPTAPKTPSPVHVPVAVMIPKSVSQTPSPPPIKKPGITREDVANVFQHGARALTRPAAVAALKKLGFGMTASYAALLPDGRFSTWLQFAPDGKITWKG
jgi:hypothetical protein